MLWMEDGCHDRCYFSTNNDMVGGMKVQSIDRTFDILELLAHHDNGMNLTEIGSSLDLPRSTVFRLLAVLKDRNYIEKSDNSVYRLGLGFIGLCSGLLNSLELKTEAQVHLRRLSHLTGQVAFLAIEQEGEVAYIDKVEKHKEIRSYCFIGQRVAMYCSALGKSLLMAWSDDEIRQYAAETPMSRKTANTIIDAEALVNEVNLSRSRGYSVDNEEIDMGMKCVAAPIFDYRKNIVAAVSTSWDLSLYEEDVTEKNIALVKETALEISLRMGLQGRSR